MSENNKPNLLTGEEMSIWESLSGKIPPLPYAPLAAFNFVHRLSPVPAIELAITRTGRDVLFVRREADDQHFPGQLWYLPGGFVNCHCQTLVEACLIHSKKDLGIDVEPLKTNETIVQATERLIKRKKQKDNLGLMIEDLDLLIIGSYKWKTGEHPYGNPVSIILSAVMIDDPIIDQEKWRFFDCIPENTVAVHKKFIERFFKTMSTRNL